MAADASDHDAMTIHSSIYEDEEEEDDEDPDDDTTSSTINNNDDIDDHHHPHHHQHHHLPHTLSRLSVCTSKSDHSMYDNYDDDAGGHYDMRMYRPSLSNEGSDGDDADDEDDHDQFSDDDDDDDGSKVGNKGGVVSLSLLVSSDSDREDEPGCYSLPATPPRRRSSTRGGGSTTLINYLRPTDVAKQYASENEADHQKDVIATSTKKQRRNWRRRIIRERWLERVWNKKKKTIQEDDDEDLIIQQFNNNNNSGTSHRFSGGGGGGELIGGGGGGDHYQAGLVIMTRPTGGRRSLCMDLEEVKACRDLGFELEHERMMLDYNNINISSRISMNSGSTIDTASTSTSTGTGGNSPIANWRISSPGDDPKDVKARLKVWAQAVALAYASHSRLLGELN